MKLTRIAAFFFTLLFTGAFQVSRAQVWRPLGEGVGYTPIAMTADQNNLWVVYSSGFTEKGKNYGISVWNGNFWRQLPTFTTDSLSTITRIKFYKGSVYIAGKFRTVHGLQNAINIIRWNGKTYQSITPKIPQPPAQFGIVNDLEIYQDKLFIGGEFNEIQEVKYSHLMAWDGEKFIAPFPSGVGLNGTVVDLHRFNDTLFVSGAFNTAGGEPSFGIAAIVPGGWKRYKEPGRKFLRLQDFQGKFMAYTQDSLKNRDIVLWQNGRVESMSKGIDYLGTVYDLTSYNGEIWMSGLFEMSDEENVQTIIRFKEGLWSSIPLGTIAGAKLLHVFDGKLITSGGFLSYGKLTLNRIAFYDQVSGFVTGRVFYDKNTNCIFDNRDEIINDRFIVITPGPYVLRPDNLGIYRAFLPPGNYEARISEKKYWSASAGCSEIRKFTVKEGTAEDSLDFAQQLQQGIQDVKITLTNSGGWRTAKGSTNLYMLSYENLGSNTINEGVIKLKIREGLNQIKTFPAYDSINKDFIYWNYRLLNSGEQRKIAVYITIPGDYQDNNLQLAANIQGIQGETENSDNTDSISQRVNGTEIWAFSKQAYPSPAYPDSVSYLAPGQTDLSYTITFANFGTDTVRTVYVIDTLDLNIAMQYTQETGSSHPYSTQVINGPPGSNLGILIWTFPNINLKPNPGKYSDFVGDKGFISFKVKLKSGLTEGTKILNTAHVVFDLDEFHQTNSVEAKISKSVGIKTQEKNVPANFKVYPNPVSDHFNIEYPSGEKVKWQLIDGLGRIIQSGEHLEHDNPIKVDTRSITPGTYILCVSSEKENPSHFRLIIGK